MLEATNTEKENSTNPNPIVSRFFQYGGHIISHIHSQGLVDFIDKCIENTPSSSLPSMGMTDDGREKKFIKVCWELPSLGYLGATSDLYGRDAGDGDAFSDDMDGIREVYRPFGDDVRPNPTKVVDAAVYPPRPAKTIAFIGMLIVGKDGKYSSDGICWTAMGHSSFNFPEKEPTDPHLQPHEEAASKEYWFWNKLAHKF